MHLTSLTRSSQFLFLSRQTHRSLNPCPQKRLHGLSSSQTPAYGTGLYASCTIRPVLSVVAWRCVEVAIEDVVMERAASMSSTRVNFSRTFPRAAPLVSSILSSAFHWAKSTDFTPFAASRPGGGPPRGGGRAAPRRGGLLSYVCMC